MPATLIKGRAWLLQCIGTLPALQQLTFKNMSLARHKYVQQLSALTASSELTSLRVMETAGAGAPLPQEALQYMFPAGKQMPNIRELQVSAEVYSCERNDTYAPCVTAVDIQRISSACPQLKRLSLSYVVAVDVADSLRSLPRTLRELNIAGHPLGDAAVGAITHLKGLQDLTWLSRTLSSVGLQQLQELSGLTRLHFANNEAVAAFDRRRWPDLEFALAWNAKDCVLQTAPEVRACCRGCESHAGAFLARLCFPGHRHAMGMHVQESHCMGECTDRDALFLCVSNYFCLGLNVCREEPCCPNHTNVVAAC
jgi:hypothetical protein